METALLDRYAKSYPLIANELLPLLPAGWSSASVLAEVGEDTGVVVGFYLVGASKDPQWLELPTSLYNVFRDMRDAAASSGDRAQVFTSATFDLKPDGKFDVGYGYDAIGVDDEDERIAAWTAKHTA